MTREWYDHVLRDLRAAADRLEGVADRLLKAGQLPDQGGPEELALFATVHLSSVRIRSLTIELLAELSAVQHLLETRGARKRNPR